jgi:hypothetical protein
MKLHIISKTITFPVDIFMKFYISKMTFGVHCIFKKILVPHTWDVRDTERRSLGEQSLRGISQGGESGGGIPARKKLGELKAYENIQIIIT